MTCRDLVGIELDVTPLNCSSYDRQIVQLRSLLFAQRGPIVEQGAGLVHEPVPVPAPLLASRGIEVGLRAAPDLDTRGGATRLRAERSE